MPMAHIRKVGGENDLYHIHYLDQHTDPGYGQGRPGGEYPGNRPPGSGSRPDQGLPGHEGAVDPGYGRPGGGGGMHPGNRPPGSGGGGIPDNSLPDQPPPQIKPGWLLILARGQDGKWHYAALQPGTVPPKPLPEPLPPDAGTKPIDPDAPTAGQPLPPIAPPTGGTPLPPTATPKA